jgi:hypothetical protein
MVDDFCVEAFRSKIEKDTVERQMRLLYQIQSHRDKGVITPLEVAPLLQSGYIKIENFSEGSYSYSLTEKGRDVSFKMSLDLLFDI